MKTKKTSKKSFATAWPSAGFIVRRSLASSRHHSRNSGFTLLELVMTMAVGVILIALAVPSVVASVQYFKIRSAVSSVTSAIQSTRYQAIFNGCPYTLTLNNTANTFQIASETNSGSSCAASFTNVGHAVPFGPSTVALNQAITLQFHPSGYVQATTGATTFTLSYGTTTKTVTVSNYGNITVTP